MRFFYLIFFLKYHFKNIFFFFSLKRVYEFLLDQKSKIHSMSDEEFKKHRKSLETKLIFLK
jgi:hypothetical protein